MTQEPGGRDVPLPHPTKWWEGISRTALVDRFRGYITYGKKLPEENGVIQTEGRPEQGNRGIIIPDQFEVISYDDDSPKGPKIYKAFYEPAHDPRYPKSEFAQSATLKTEYNLQGQLQAAEIRKAKEFTSNTVHPVESAALYYQNNGELRAVITGYSDTNQITYNFSVMYDPTGKFVRAVFYDNSENSSNGDNDHREFFEVEDSDAIPMIDELKKDGEMDVGSGEFRKLWKAKYDDTKNSVQIVRIDDAQQHTDTIAKWPLKLANPVGAIVEKILPSQKFGTFGNAELTTGEDDLSWKNAYPPALLGVSFTAPKAHIEARKKAA